jgi:hypothetical protein
MITIGPVCRIIGMRPELTLGLMAINAVIGPVRMILTHVMDGVHSRASIHYAGGAGDLVFKDNIPWEEKEALYERSVKAVGVDFDLVFESKRAPNEHWHLEYQPKEPY